MYSITVSVRDVSVQIKEFRVVKVTSLLMAGWKQEETTGTILEAAGLGSKR